MAAERGERLVLASTSPRRSAILGQLSVPFEVVTPTYRETEIAGCEPGDLVARHARGKARSALVEHPGRLILGVDTGVELEGQLYGKPRDRDDAIRILTRLAGRTHSVISGVCLADDDAEEVELAQTAVTFRPLNPGQIERYVETGEWRGLAGGYAIQGLGALLVESLEGDYLNVVGLPAATLVRMLERRRPYLLPLGV